MMQELQDSVKVSSNITSNSVLDKLPVLDQLQALWNMVHLDYIAITILTAYVIITRVQFIQTRKTWQQNLLIFILTIVYGLAGYFIFKQPALHMFVSGLIVNAAYEYLFKAAFHWLEKKGVVGLPEWYVEEAKAKAEKEIAHLENAKVTPPQQ